MSKAHLSNLCLTSVWCFSMICFRKMLGVRSSRRLQQGRRSSTRGVRTSTRRHPARSNASVSITCEAEVHSTHDDPSLQLRFKPKAVTVVIDDSDDETANEVNTTPDDHNRCGGATNKDSGHFSGDSPSIPKATPMDVDGVATPDSGVTCPKLSQRASVSLGERCSGDLVQNLSTNVASPAARDSGLPTVKDAVGVTEGTPGDAIAVDTPPTTPSMSSRTPGRIAIVIFDMGWFVVARFGYKCFSCHFTHMQFLCFETCFPVGNVRKSKCKNANPCRCQTLGGIYMTEYRGLDEEEV